MVTWLTHFAYLRYLSKTRSYEFSVSGERHASRARSIRDVSAHIDSLLLKVTLKSEEWLRESAARIVDSLFPSGESSLYDSIARAEEVDGLVQCALIPRTFPCDISHPPREWAERFFNVQRWTEMPRGGHFAAMEEPAAFAEEVRAFFRPWR